MTVSRSGFLVGAALASSVALLGASPPRTNLTIAAIPSDISGEAWYANELGYFKAAGFETKIYPLTNGASIAAAVASGSADIGYSNVISLATAHQRGIPFTILAPANLHVHGAPTAGLLAVRKAGPIQSAKDLSGKVVAVIGLNNIAHVATRYWIDKNGGDSTTVKFIELPFSEMSAAVIAGRVDAAALDAVGDPTAGTPDDPLRRLGSTFDAVSPRFAPSVWFTTKDWVQKHHDEAAHFAAVMQKTARWANRHHSESADMLAVFAHLTRSNIDRFTRATYGDRISVDLVQPSIDAAARYGVIKSAFPAPELISSVAI